MKAGEIWINESQDIGILIMKRVDDEVYSVAPFGIMGNIEQAINGIRGLGKNVWPNNITRKQIVSVYIRYYEGRNENGL